MERVDIRSGDNFLFKVDEYRLGIFFVKEYTFKEDMPTQVEFDAEMVHVEGRGNEFFVDFRTSIFEEDIDKAIMQLQAVKEVLKEYKASKTTENK